VRMSERCLRAADYLAEHGHVRTIMRDPGTGAVCLAGALAMVSESGTDSAGMPVSRREATELHSALDFLDAQVPQVDPLYFGCLGPQHNCVTWNNLPTTSKEDVVLELKNGGVAARELGL